MGWRGRSGARSSEVGAEEECEQGSARGRGSTRAAGWGSRWAASGRLPGSSSRSRAGSGAAAQPGPRAAGGTRRGVPQTPASTSSPSTVSVSGAGGGREGGPEMGWGRGEVRGGRAALGGPGLEGCPRVGAESAAIWASHGRRGTPLPPPGSARLSSLAGSVWGRRRQREQAGVLGT